MQTRNMELPVAVAQACIARRNVKAEQPYGYDVRARKDCLWFEGPKLKPRDTPSMRMTPSASPTRSRLISARGHSSDTLSAHRTRTRQLSRLAALRSSQQWRNEASPKAVGTTLPCDLHRCVQGTNALGVWCGHTGIASLRSPHGHGRASRDRQAKGWPRSCIMRIHEVGRVHRLVAHQSVSQRAGPLAMCP